MKNVIYIRVSTQDQANLGHSLEYQKNQLLNYCKNTNINKPTIYADEGYSASSINRPKYKQLLNEIKNKKIRRIIFLKIDRISRNIIDFRNFVDLCKQNDVSIISLQEKFEDSAIGNFSRDIVISLAEMERNQISERDKNTGNLYYDDNKKIIIDIFDLDTRSYSNIKIAKIINNKYDLSSLNINVDYYFINRVLNNTLYYGYKIYNGKKYDLFDPLIKYQRLENSIINKYDNTNIRKNKRIKYNHLYKFSQKIKYIDDEHFLYASTVRKFLKSTCRYKEYKYYFSNDKKIKLNEEYLIRLINEHIISTNKYNK